IPPDATTARCTGTAETAPATRRRARSRAARAACGGSATAAVRAGRDSAPATSVRARLRNHRSLEQVVRRIGEECRHLFERNAVRDQLVPGIRAAREEGKRGAHGVRRVVKGAAKRHLLVVELVGVELDPFAAREPAEQDDGPTLSDQAECLTP